MKNRFGKLLEALQNARCPMAFTGAGVSTLSGIRDFRGKNGVYHEPWRGMNVEELLSLDCFLEHPEYFYGWAREFVYRLDAFQPGPPHLLLAELEKRGLLREIITQNIDLLHQRAGSRNVCEIHGSPAENYCLKCQKLFSYEEVAPKIMNGGVPHCPCGGVIKPKIVFYGENLDETTLDHAFDAMRSCDFLLVMGSSLTVQPAASMPVAAVRAGAVLAIVNDMPTPMDPYAQFRFADLGTFSEGMMAELLKN